MATKTWLGMWTKRYEEMGKTFQTATVTFEPIIFTIEPENIKAVLATDFNSFEMGERRRKVLGQLVGPGIFMNDGAAWKHSRVSEFVLYTYKKCKIDFDCRL